MSKKVFIVTLKFKAFFESIQIIDVNPIEMFQNLS